jgi:hypothetical protein
MILYFSSSAVCALLVTEIIVNKHCIHSGRAISDGNFSNPSSTTTTIIKSNLVFDEEGNRIYHVKILNSLILILILNLVFDTESSFYFELLAYEQHVSATFSFPQKVALSKYLRVKNTIRLDLMKLRQYTFF